MLFIVQAKPWKPEEIEEVIAITRNEALRFCTVEEFAKIIVDAKPHRGESNSHDIELNSAL